MKFARRTEGIKSARAIFKRAREDPRSKYQVNNISRLLKRSIKCLYYQDTTCMPFSTLVIQFLLTTTFQVFVAAALMEYYCSKDKNIAFRIFELGLKKFSNCPEYVICYIDYLSHLNGE
jgi:cleavage stimulation factor subunit 3